MIARTWSAYSSPVASIGGAKLFAETPASKSGSALPAGREARMLLMRCLPKTGVNIFANCKLIN